MKKKLAKTLLAALLVMALPVSSLTATAATTEPVWEIDDFESYTLLREALITNGGIWEYTGNGTTMSLETEDSALDGSQSLRVDNNLVSYGWTTIRYAPLEVDRQNILNDAYTNGTDVKLVFYAKADVENTIRITFLPNLNTPNYGVFEAYVDLTTEWTRYELSLTDDFTCRNTSPNDDAVTDMNAIEGAATMLSNGTKTGLRYIEFCTNKNEGYSEAIQFTYWIDSLSFVGEDVNSNLTGDCNSDGAVTSSDALSTLQIAVGVEETPDSEAIEFRRIDMDGNGEITTADALSILTAAVQS